jgi:hypothetical protein
MQSSIPAWRRQLAYFAHGLAVAVALLLATYSLSLAGCTETFGSSAEGGADAQATDAGTDASDATIVVKTDGAGTCPGSDLLCDSGCVKSGLQNCGACGHDCSHLANVSGPVSCSASGQCSFSLSSCAPGWTHCSGNPDQGCETNVTTASNCGGCGNACPIATPLCLDAAAGYACAPCSAPTPNACSGSCVDVTSDQKNCGSCAHDCLGGACHAGLCQPITLASGLDTPTVITVGPAGVYWATNPPPDAGAGSIMTCGIDGGAVTTLATQTGVPGSPAVTATEVYWTNESLGVLTCPLAGCAGQTPFVFAPLAAKGLAIDATNVYWIQETPAAGYSCPLGGCPAAGDGGVNTKALFFGPASANAKNIAVDSKNIYWCGDQVYECPLTGCPVDADGGYAETVLSTAGALGYAPAVGISVDAANVYWGNTNALWACAIGGCANTPRQLAPNTDAYQTASDGINVYWTDIIAGAIDRCAISGCNGQPTVMATGQTPYGLALDATSIYWANSTGGTVMRLAK